MSAVLDVFDRLQSAGLMRIVIIPDPSVARRIQRHVAITDGYSLPPRTESTMRLCHRRGERPRMRFTDLLGEAVARITERALRTALTTLGTVLGIAALVATIGISRTAGAQIVSRLDALTATYVAAEPRSAPGRARGAAGVVDPRDAQPRTERLNGVVDAVTLSDVDVKGALMRAVAVRVTA